jgi:hypothetical protein
VIEWLRRMDGHLDALEPAFREWTLAHDRRQCAGLALVAATANVATLVSTAIRHGIGEQFLVVQTLFLVLALVAGAAAVGLARARTPRRLDQVSFALVVLFVPGFVASLGVVADRPGFPGAIVVALALWAFFPQNLAVRGGGALACGLGTAALALDEEGSAGSSVFADLAALTMANVFGFWLSTRDHRTRRETFRAAEAARRAGDDAARMRQLLPVCAWCGRLRDETGFWRTVHEFVDGEALRTTATALCDDCRASVPREELGRGEDASAAVDDLAGDRSRALVLIATGTILVLGVLLASFVLPAEGETTGVLLVIRLAELGACLGALAILALSSSRRVLQGTVFLWTMALAAMVAWLSVQRVESITLSVVALAATAFPMMLPLPIVLRMLPALLMAAAGTWAAVTGGAVNASQFVAALLAGLVVGVGFSEQAIRHRRMLQATLEEARAARALVERIGALLPVCRSCHKVRDEDGYWRSVRAYLETATERRATHGLCQNCLEAEFAPEAEALRDQ